MHISTAALGLGGLLFAFVVPRLTILQSILLAPAFASLILVLLTAAACHVLLRREGKGIGGRQPSGVGSIKHLSFTTESAWSVVLTRALWDEAPLPTGRQLVAGSSRSTLATRLDALLTLIKQSFVLSWYERISPSVAFPGAVEQLLRKALIDIGTRGHEVDWAPILATKVVPLLSEHLHHYRTVEHLAVQASNNKSDILPLPLPRHCHAALRESSEADLVSSSPKVENHLRQIADRVLGVMISPENDSTVIRVLMREILVGTVLLPMIDMLCDGDFWNRQIDERGGRYLHEQKQVSKFLAALSTLPPTGSLESPVSGKSSRSAQASTISAESTSQQFDAFIRSISRLKSLGEARRLRSDIERELRLASSRGAALVDSEQDKQRKRLAKYMMRLERAKYQVDLRISALSGSLQQDASSKLDLVDSAQRPPISIAEVLSDPSSLAYWLEFMERRNRSKLVQFWLAIESFKTPLLAEEAVSDPLSGPLNDVAVNIGTGDLSFLFEAYMRDDNPKLDIPARYLAAIETATNDPSNMEHRSVGQTLLACQQAVVEQMRDDDWPLFVKSDLYVKTVADLRKGLAAAPVTSRTTRAVSEGPILPLSDPAKPKRQFSNPVRTAESLSPSPLAPKLLNGILVAPHSGPAVSVTTAHSGYVDDLRHVPRPRRTVSAESRSTVTDMLATPVSMTRRSSHLEALMSPTSEEGPSTLGRKLFDEDDDTISHPLEAAKEADDFVEINRMEAIQAALNEIIASDDVAGGRASSTSKFDDGVPASMSSSLVFQRPRTSQEKMSSRSLEDLRTIRPPSNPKSAPSSRVASAAQDLTETEHLPISKDLTSHQRSLFQDDGAADDETADFGLREGDAQDVVQLAAPGDLQLSVEIARLQDRFQDLVQQDHLLDNLIRQAELTGSQAELRILHQSQTSVRREQRTVILQKAQFEHQEEENRLQPGRTRVIIPSSVITAEDGDHGKQVVRYTVEVTQVNGDGTVALSWVVARRYNQFFELDRALREWAATSGDPTVLEHFRASVKELPGKKLVTNMSASFIDSRRLGLEAYLQSLVTSSVMCESHALRFFLSRSSVQLNPALPGPSGPAALAPHNIVKSLYKTMATSLDDAMLGPSMLDLMYTTLSRQLNDVAGGIGSVTGFGPEELASIGNALRPHGLLPESMSSWLKNPNAGRGPSLPSTAALTPSPALLTPGQPTGADPAMTSFSASICDLFIELFDLKENNWLRRQAIVIIIQQFLGSTIERKIRDTIASLLSSDSVERMLASLQETLWPGGVRRPPSVPRSESEKNETRHRASRKLALLMPDVAASMIGRSNARRASRRVFGALQDQRLNQHLMLSVLDEIVNAMFPTESTNGLSSFEGPLSRCLLALLVRAHSSAITERPQPFVGDCTELLLFPHQMFERRGLEDWLQGQTSPSLLWSRLSDAQRVSIYCIFGYFIAIFAFWNGLFGLRRLVDRGWRPDSWLTYLPILWPFKILTVLIHEMGHAFTGLIFSGFRQKVTYIHVDAWEGGETGFGKAWPNDWSQLITLMAGYTTSCIVGCLMFFCGFDTLYSKYAALSIGLLLTVTLIVCVFSHDWVQWKLSGFGSAQRKADAEARWKSDRTETMGKAALVSLDILMGVSLCFLFMLSVTWYFADSIALRFLVLFMGELSALYAIWDVVLDGIRYNVEISSDITEFVRWWAIKHDPKLRRAKADDIPRRKGLEIGEGWAVFWVVSQSILLVVAAVFGLRYLPYSFAEQALRARSWLPTPNHWSPADTLAEAKQAFTS